MLECDGDRDTFTATMSPFFLGDSSLVFRRGPGLRGRTVAYDASKTAATVDRELVARLGSSEHELRVTIRALGPASRAPARCSSCRSRSATTTTSAGARSRCWNASTWCSPRTRAGCARSGSGSAPIRTGDQLSRSQRGAARRRRARAPARAASGSRSVSDAGTPLCSDPGYVVVSRAVEEGIAVCPVPGPSAALAVLAASGLPLDRFVFGGFLPRRSAQRRQVVQELTALGCAVVFYEAAPAPRGVAGRRRGRVPGLAGLPRARGDEDVRGVPARIACASSRSSSRRRRCWASARSWSRRRPEPAPARAASVAAGGELDDAAARAARAGRSDVDAGAGAARRCPGSVATRRTNGCSRSAASLRRPRRRVDMTITRVIGKARTVALDAAALGRHARARTRRPRSTSVRATAASRTTWRPPIPSGS